MTDTDRTEALFREYHLRLSRFARHLVGPGADADDLVQETFFRAHKRLRNGKAIRTPLSYLFVTMRNLVNDAGRHARTAPVESIDGGTEQLTDDAAPSVETRAMSEHEFERLCVAIEELPERIRHAFVLRKVYGYSCREIAEQLGRSTNTVREQVAQGFKRLRSLRQREDQGSASKPDAKETTRVHSVTATQLVRRES